MLDPRDFFEATREYNRSADNETSKGHLRFATVDKTYTGAGPTQVTFDGETSMTGKLYQFIGTAPLAGSRVLMMPVNTTYVILGMLNGGA